VKTTLNAGGVTGVEKVFSWEYHCNARKQGVKEQITELTMNSSGVRDISRILHINKNTVISELKKNSTPEPLYS
jgi:transposase-like protein